MEEEEEEEGGHCLRVEGVGEFLKPSEVEGEVELNRKVYVLRDASLQYKSLMY